MFDTRSIVYGAMYHGGVRIFFHKDKAYSQAWYRGPKDEVVIIGWLDEGDMRSLQATGIKVEWAQKPENGKLVAGLDTAESVLKMTEPEKSDE